MWTYSVTLREFFDPSGELIAAGYSGRDTDAVQGKNNPVAEGVRDVGPIPRGRYQIGPVFDSQEHGPVVMRLTPEPGTDTFGRDGFLIHGDSIQMPGTASHGCVILPRPARLAVAASADRELEVTA